MTEQTGHEPDWAEICRQYRLQFGLKQEAFASDFNVSQSTVSRWESGERVPGRSAQRKLLAAIPDPSARPLAAEMANRLTNSSMPMALWDRQGRLRGCSDWLLDEIKKVVAIENPVGKHADAIVPNRGLMRVALALFEEIGFFDGKVTSVTLHSPPVSNRDRIRLGGTLVVHADPTELADGSIGMLCCYSHDALHPTPAEFEFRFKMTETDETTTRTLPVLQR